MSPALIMAVRHGESAANVAFNDPATRDRPVVLSWRDADVPLTETGRGQAVAVGRWLRSLSPDRRPEIVRCSPYARAKESWALIAAELDGEFSGEVSLDDRLKDRVMGELQLMNALAVAERFPAEARRRREVGEYAYRPPGGESFADVAARLRGMLGDLDREADGKRVLIVAHDAVVVVLRHILEGRDDTDLTGLAVFGPIANASVTTWERRHTGLALVEFNRTAHLG